MSHSYIKITKKKKKKKKKFTCALKTLCKLVSRSFFRIECSSIITALMFILSLGSSIEQATPIPSITIKQS